MLFLTTILLSLLYSSTGTYYEKWSNGGTASMSCGSGKYLYVTNAKYYAPGAWLCKPDSSAAAKTYALCNYKRGCSFSPYANKFFGNPCWLVKKRFSCNYYCKSCTTRQYFITGTGCRSCPGTQVSEGGTPTSCNPAPCQPGNYMDSKVCKPCSEGYWSAGQLVSSCTKCPAGKTVAAGKGKAEGDCNPAPCQPGNYMDSGVCKPCSEGYWSAGQFVSSCTKCRKTRKNRKNSCRRERGNRG